MRPEVTDLGLPDDHTFLFAFMKAATPLGTRGSHSQVYALSEDGLAEALDDLAKAFGASETSRAEIRLFARLIARRFLLKVGNIRDYVVKLRGGRETIISRSLMSEVFGPVGYNLAPHYRKVLHDARDAVREIPYFGFGKPEDQFAPDLLAHLRSLLRGERPTASAEEAIFLVEQTSFNRNSMSAFDFLSSDPYLPEPIRDFPSLRRFQEFVRSIPVTTQMRERIQAFFEAPMTVGLRDVLRFLEGSRHPRIGWQGAEAAIRKAFERFGKENFLPPEINYYTYSVDLPPELRKTIEKENQRAARALARLLVERAPLPWTIHLSDGELEALARGILEIHHDYPIYQVEPYTGIFSAATLRLLGRLALGLAIHLSGLKLPDRRNILTEDLAKDQKVVIEFLQKLPDSERPAFLALANRLLLETALMGGVKAEDGRVLPFRRLDRTFYSFQEKAQYPIENKGTVHAFLTLEDLLGTSEGRALLEKNPSIAERLLVFFTLVYRYFLDTGFVADLRPDDAGRDLFLMGHWGYKTRNVIVVAGEEKGGAPTVVVRFVDNKDQFKQYRRFEDRSRPLGLARYGLRLVHPLVEPAMERSIGIFAQMVAQDSVSTTGKGIAARVNHMLKETVDAALTHTQAFLHDLIDDLSDGIERLL